MTISLIKAQKNITDARTVMHWRNDPTTLAMFYNQTPKAWNTFWHEYVYEYFIHASLTPLFATYNQEKIAFLRFNEYNDANLPQQTIDIDINIAPHHRGNGYARIIILQAVDLIFNNNLAASIIAEIKQHNIASIKSFQAAGFNMFDQKLKHINNQSIPIVRFIKNKHDHG